MSLAQILAIVIFVAMFVLIVLDKFERHHITLICGAATLLLVFGLAMRSVPAMWETLNLQSFFTVDFWYAAEESGSSAGINWSTILFILGMMIMVEGMAKAGFFRWLCLALAKLVHYKTVPLFLAFMLLSAVLAMFIDSITVILFLAAVTVELAKLLKFNPIPMIISEIFCANLGGSATMCGDPPNIIIGTALGYSFADFLVNTGLIAGVGLIAAVVFFYLGLPQGAAGPGRRPGGPGGDPRPGERHLQQGGLRLELRHLRGGGGPAGHPRHDRPDGVPHRGHHRRGHPAGVLAPRLGAAVQGGL